MGKNKFNLPTHYFIKDGGVSDSRIAKVQRMQIDEGSNTHKRYKDYWEKVEASKINKKPRTVVDEIQEFERVAREYTSSPTQQVKGVNGEMGMENRQRQQNLESADEVWIGIKFDEESSHYTLRNMYGESINRSDFIKIKSDELKYEEFEFKCWSEFIEKDISNKEELYQEISQLLEMPVGRIKGARVDSEYVEDIEDVVISFKARITKGAWC